MVNVICCCCWFWSVFDFSLWPFIFRIRIQCQTEKGWQKFNLGTSNLNGLGQSSREKTKIWKIRMLSQDMGLQQFHDLFTFPPWWSDKRGNLKISLLFVKVLFNTNPTKPQPSKSVAPFKRYYRKKFLLRRPSEYLYYLIKLPGVVAEEFFSRNFWSLIWPEGIPESRIKGFLSIDVCST